VIADRGHRHRSEIPAVEALSVVGRRDPYSISPNRVSSEWPRPQRPTLGISRQWRRVWKQSAIYRYPSSRQLHHVTSARDDGFQKRSRAVGATCRRRAIPGRVARLANGSAGQNSTRFAASIPAHHIQTHRQRGRSVDAQSGAAEELKQWQPANTPRTSRCPPAQSLYQATGQSSCAPFSASGGAVTSASFGWPLGEPAAARSGASFEQRSRWPSALFRLSG
jgi:hypothetical protein